MPTLRRQIIIASTLLRGRPPKKWAFCYSLSRSSDHAPFYVGQTQRARTDRLADHVALARNRAGKNRRLEARIRRLAEQGDELVMRVEGMYPVGDETAAAERVLIAEWRAKLGITLLNQGPGGERAPGHSDGRRHALSVSAVHAACEEEDGDTVLFLLGGRALRIGAPLATVLGWLVGRRCE
jgi:hypothetical protein